MTVTAQPSSTLPSRLSAPGLIVTLFVLVMSACVLGLVIWKAVDARKAALSQNEVDIRNLAHSLAEHASHTIQAADVAMNGMVDLLQYQNPRSDRFNLFLANTVRSLPQLREIGVLDALGEWRYSSLPELPAHNNYDRSYFTFHRENADHGLRISDPLKSRLTGKMTIILSKRINKPDGSFHGVLTAAIDSDYFNDFYKTFQLGEQAGISLMRNDGIVLVHWPSQDVGKDLSATPLFRSKLKESSTGYYKITSPFDGIAKFFGYEQSPEYPIIVSVAIPEEKVLASWRGNLQADIAVAAVLLCSVILLAALLSTQFRFRLNMENVLRERESRYRLLADNIADVVILLDRHGNFVFVSHSVEFVLGLDPKNLIGRSCFELVHPDDITAVKAASAQLTDPTATRTAIFRTFRDDRSVAWVEINFKLAARAEDHDKIEIVGVLRDVTQRKLMQDELTALNARLSQLATTDGLTGLANRRTLDGFLRREYERHDEMSVLLIDIDNFKGYNDSMGHQAGDEVIKRVAEVVAQATENTPALSARYGGEEFAIILPDVAEADALIVAEAVRLKVRALEIPNAAAVRGYLSISVGIGSRELRTPNEAVLVGEADLALYEAKRRGRDCVVASSALAHEYYDTGLIQNG
jgi:diguanylate cyclase (GGDEF)-like protein/PAS domain S-box-containing protein